jgi:hypothetical protein
MIRRCFAWSSARIKDKVFSGPWRRPQFRSHGGGGNASDYANTPGLVGWYLRTNSNYPLATAVLTAAGLWCTGDVVAQQISIYCEDGSSKKEGSSSEGHGEKKEAHASSRSGMDLNRLIGTTVEGSAVGGGVGYFPGQHCLQDRPGERLDALRLRQSGSGIGHLAPREPRQLLGHRWPVGRP